MANFDLPDWQTISQKNEQLVNLDAYELPQEFFVRCTCYVPIKSNDQIKEYRVSAGYWRAFKQKPVGNTDVKLLKIV